jgi:hypothetical protein
MFSIKNSHLPKSRAPTKKKPGKSTSSSVKRFNGSLFGCVGVVVARYHHNNVKKMCYFEAFTFHNNPRKPSPAHLPSSSFAHPANINNRTELNTKKKQTDWFWLPLLLMFICRSLRAHTILMRLSSFNIKLSIFLPLPTIQTRAPAEQRKKKEGIGNVQSYDNRKHSKPPQKRVYRRLHKHYHLNWQWRCGCCFMYT